MPALTSDEQHIARGDMVVRSVLELQKAVAIWFNDKASPSDEVYSPGWEETVTEWRNWFIASYPAQKPATVIASSTVDEFDVRIFFLATPGPGFLLWEILQSCYDLDKAICGMNELALSEIVEWQHLKTFQYLTSETISARWRAELAKLNDGLRAGLFSQAAFEDRLYTILRCVQRLEVARNCWDSEMNASIPHQFLGAIHHRCYIIERSFAALEESLSRA